MRTFEAILLILGLPAATFSLGIYLLGRICGGDSVQPVLNRGPYGEKMVRQRFEALAKLPDGFGCERRRLKADLAFAFCYGVVLTVSIVVGAGHAGWLSAAFWLLLPVKVAVFADWVENLIQLELLTQYEATPRKQLPTLSPKKIVVASQATVMKWVALGACVVELVAVLVGTLRH